MPAKQEISERKNALISLEPADFVKNVMFAAPPHAFRNSPSEYLQFLQELENRLDIPQNNIFIIGSARIGFSLNRAHLFSEFRSESDIDIVVVSSVLFDQTWVELVTSTESYFLIGLDEAKRFKEAKLALFDGYFRPDRIPLSAQLAKSWFPKLASRFTSPIAQLHSVSAWLFKSLDHAVVFYSKYIRNVKPIAIKAFTMQGET